MQTVAAKRFKRDGFRLVAVYFVIYFASFGVSIWRHPAGAVLWVLGVLPVLPMVGVIAVIARYLRDETDEYKRDVTIRCLLWGCAGAVSASLLEGFVRIFGWKGQMPPFLGFWVFFVLMMAAKLSYRYKDQAEIGGGDVL